MDNYDSVISQLGKQVSEIAPQTKPIYSYNWMKWKSYYVYVLIPISVIIILLGWRPGFMMHQNKEGKRSIKVKIFFMSVVVISIILSGIYMGYKMKFGR